MPDMLAKVACERGTLFVGKVELHLDKVPWVRADFNTSDRRFQGRQVIWPRGIMRASERAITPDSLDGLGRQDRRPRKRWANCRFVLSPVGSVRIQPPDPA